MREVRLVAVDADQILQRPGEAGLRMRFPFGQVDDQVGVEHRLADQVAVVAGAVAAAGERRIVIVNRESIGLVGDRLEMAAAVQLHFAIARRITVRRIGIQDELGAGAGVDFPAQVAKLDTARMLGSESLDDLPEAGLPAHQRPVGPLFEAIAHRNRRRRGKQRDAGPHGRIDHGGARHHRRNRKLGVGFVHHPVRLDDDAARPQVADTLFEGAADQFRQARRSVGVTGDQREPTERAALSMAPVKQACRRPAHASAENA
jgi:hypothetical protein